MIIENMTAKEALEWAISIIFELCEETENDPRLSLMAEEELEGKPGAFARGRIFEAKSLRNAVGEALRTKLGPDH